MNKKYSNIVITDHTLWGAPRIKDHRLAVCDVIFSLKFDALVTIHDTWQLNNEEVKDALDYCANQQCLEDKPKNFCHHCVLANENEEPIDLSEYEEFEINQELYVKSNNSFFLGSLKEIIEDYKGLEYWKIAAALKEEYKNIL